LRQSVLREIEPSSNFQRRAAQPRFFGATTGGERYLTTLPGANRFTSGKRSRSRSRDRLHSNRNGFDCQQGIGEIHFLALKPRRVSDERRPRVVLARRRRGVALFLSTAEAIDLPFRHHGGTGERALGLSFSLVLVEDRIGTCGGFVGFYIHVCID
jgi:hypothetical protein